MSNNVLALIIIVVSFWAVWGQRTMDGVGAFVLTLGGFWLYNKFKG